MPRFEIGDRVYVSCHHFEELDGQPFALYRATIQNVVNRSIQIELPGGVLSEPISSGLAHADLGIAIIAIGDFDTEATLLDPLTKSILQFCRLLLGDDQIRICRARSLDELRLWFGREGNAYTHCILIGHGSPQGIRFGVGGIAPATILVDAFADVFDAPKHFISLCCETGRAAFGKVFSNQENVCSSLVAPFHSVHGAIASQFCQSFLADHLLHGYSLPIAFQHARRAVPLNTSFRLWSRGRMTA